MTNRFVHPLSDSSLARRLERAEGAVSAAFVEARARLQPGSGAASLEVGSARVMFDGVESPLSQSFGLGFDGAADAAVLGALEHFLRERGAPVMHEVSPMVDASWPALLVERGYRPVEFTSVLCRPLPGDGIPAVPDDAPAVRPIAPGEERRWAEISAEGWSEFPELGDFMREFGLVSASSAGTVAFLAELDGEPIGTGALGMADGVALLAGASTVVRARRRGAQRALLAARLRHAAAAGCDLAMMGAAPGSVSQNNAERAGFRIAYTRVKWGLAAGA